MLHTCEIYQQDIASCDNTLSPFREPDMPLNAAEVGRMIDATSYYELEAEEYKRKGVQLTPDLWLVKLMVGAIDHSFDEQD